MTVPRPIYYFVLFISAFCYGQQELQKGFELLETGQFETAEHFFGDYLKSEPAHKTAQICYGRAVGLSGEPQRANQWFAGLLETYPKDVEIQINYNESFLWDEQYAKAKPLYQELVASNPDNFAAVLGYANTLSNLKEYREALDWVEKALVLKPDNKSAQLSRKYMRLGHANEQIAKQRYREGETLLEAIFTDFPEDKDVLLNLANLYLITKEVAKAKAIYGRYATSPKDSITALNGIALAAHIGENDRQALRTAKRSKSGLRRFDDPELTEKTYDRYVQALIWNRKFHAAKRQIDSLDPQYPDRNWVRALKATLGMYTGDFKASLEQYNAILDGDGQSFDGNLGKANALFASDCTMAAYKAAFNTLDIFKNQKDALGLIEKMDALHTPAVEEQVAYTFDNGNNIAFSTNTLADVPLSTTFRTTVSYQYRSTENSVSGNKANSHVVLAGLLYKPFPKTLLKTIFGLNNARFTNEAYTQPVLNVKLGLKPYKLQNLELGYQREVQNFNADLIEREIVMNHYGLNYNLGTNFNLGWYTQLMHTQQTDANTRNLLFTSLYYNVLHKPALKLGVNYQYIAFKEQLPTVYFSPEQYRAMEVFVDFRGKVSEKTSYLATAATGLQRVEEDPQTAIFRAEAGVRHQFSKRLSGNIYGKYSNIASATAAGFEFTELGLKLKWLLAKWPLFHDHLYAQKAP